MATDIQVNFTFGGRPGTALVRPGFTEAYWILWGTASCQIEAARPPLRAIVDQAVHAHFAEAR